MVHVFLLKENVLTDNTLHIPDTGKRFIGGYVAVLKEFTYQNPWTDKESTRKFRSKGRLCSYLKKTYPDTYGDMDFSDTCLDD